LYRTAPALRLCHGPLRAAIFTTPAISAAFNPPHTTTRIRKSPAIRRVWFDNSCKFPMTTTAKHTKMITARPTRINRATTAPRHNLEHYCRDLNGWPRSWMGLEKDLPPGEQLVTLFPSFPRTSGSVGPVAEDDPEVHRQHVGTRRRVHPRSPQRPLAEKKAGGPGPFQDDRIRRATSVPESEENA
jgi:hypothetical protein